MTDPAHHHFVLTEDLFPIMTNWAKDYGFTIPNSRWFSQNHKQLRVAIEDALSRGTPDKVVIVDSLPCSYIASQIKVKINEIESRGDLNVDIGSVVSLDRVYSLELGNLVCYPIEINRVVDRCGNDLPRSPRPGTLSLFEQINQFKQSITSNHIIVVDDGIWTGETLKQVIAELQQQKLNVVAVVAGIKHKEPGKLINLGIDASKVWAIQTYVSYERPIWDWVCERDFFPGVPFGGRTVNFNDKNIGAYYVESNEWLNKWASINDDGSFRKICYTLSLNLFREIERLSNKSLLVANMPRLPLKVALKGVDAEDNFCDILTEEIEKI